MGCAAFPGAQIDIVVHTSERMTVKSPFKLKQLKHHPEKCDQRTSLGCINVSLSRFFILTVRPQCKLYELFLGMLFMNTLDILIGVVTVTTESRKKQW